jgi:putative alpha-1,2-mannosidase
MPSAAEARLKVKGVSDKRCYVGSVTLNDRPLTRLYITHNELLRGGVLEFRMQSQPNRRRGQLKEDKPYSFTF